MFISRTWHGAVPKQFGDGFAAYLQETGVQESQAIAGNAGAFVCRMEQEDFSHFFLCTLWRSWGAIHAFAGEQPHIAVTYPEDARYGLISDPIVIHQAVSTDANPFVVGPDTSV